MYINGTTNVFGDHLSFLSFSQEYFFQTPPSPPFPENIPSTQNMMIIFRGTKEVVIC